jgi:hypothetical protein
VTVVKHSFRCKYKGNETFCSFKIVVCKKGTYLFNSVYYLIFQWLLDLNYSPLSALNEANLTSATQTLNFNPPNELLGENVTTRWKK